MMVGQIELAEQTDQMLSVGAASFDQVNGTLSAARLLVDNRDVPVDELIRSLASKFHLDKVYDVDGEK